MSSKSTFSNSTSASYAAALYELSKENAELDNVEIAMKSLKKISFNSVLIVITFALVFGSIDEFLQSFISGRYSSGLDVLADTIGTTIGALLVSGNHKQ